MKATLSAVLACAALIAGCGGGTAMRGSSAVPSAEGSVSYSDAGSGNTGIKLQVKHLAKPERLTPPAVVYVVWLQKEKSAPPQNLGALEVDKNLTGRLVTVTPHAHFDLFVTPEATGEVQKPSGEQVLWTSR